ncbi:MAG: tetratricopeptide repeat protein [Anaerolineae bacterium]|nr:tetratricopeptide repeat protein [Anaerolineae bacterium]
MIIRLFTCRLRLVAFFLLLPSVGLAVACMPMFVTPPTPLALATTTPLPTLEAGFLPTPAPGPAPTPTPQPLARPAPGLAASLTQEGETLFLKSDLVGAEAAFINAIAADPGYLPAHIGLTRVYLYQPQYWQQALAEAEAAEKLAPDDPVVLACLSWAQQLAHHFDEARQTAQRAVEPGPESALAHAALSDVLSSVYEVEASLDHARRAVELDEQSAVAWAVLGTAQAMLHDWDAAADAYDRARELEPTFFAWHLLRANHELDTTGDLVSAGQMAAPALEVQPHHAWSLSFQADMAVEVRDWEAVEASCAQMMALDQPHTPYPDAYECMAAAMLLQERFGEAEHYQALAEERATPQRRDITLIRMRLHLEHDEYEQARALARDWLDERPYSVAAMHMLGLSYLYEEKYGQAVAAFRRAYEALPRSMDSARLLAVAYARDGQASAAMAVLNEARTFALGDPRYYQALHEVYLSLGNRQEALRAAQRWQVMRPHDTEPRVNIALVYLLLDNLTAARWAAESALADGEHSAMLYAALGETLHRQGDLEKAEEYLLQAVKRNENHYLARHFLASFYVSQYQCEKALPHLRWLLAHTTDEERVSNLKEAVEACERWAAPLPTPHPSVALSDEQATEEAGALVRAAGAEPRRVELTETKEGRALVVSYSTDLEVGDKAFAELERSLSFELARLLPRIVSRPDALLLVAGSGDRVYGITVIETRAAVLWVNGQLSDEQFEETWHRQRAPGYE